MSVVGNRFLTVLAVIGVQVRLVPNDGLITSMYAYNLLLARAAETRDKVI